MWTSVCPCPKDVALFAKDTRFITNLYARYQINTTKVEILPQAYQIWLQRKYRYTHQFPSTGRGGVETKHSTDVESSSFSSSSSSSSSCPASFSERLYEPSP
jgi:hypothetical protein